MARVCAFEDEALILEQNPGFYERGPGTSPGVSFTLVTPASPAEVAIWSERNDLARSRIDAVNYGPGAIGISCNAMDLP